jgi:hypothetical protein
VGNSAGGTPDFGRGSLKRNGKNPRRSARGHRGFFGVSHGRLNDVGGTIGDDFTIGENADSSDFGFDGFDFDMYSLQLGRNFGNGFYGFNTTAYLEVSYLDADADVSFDGDPEIGVRVNF